MYLRSTPRRNKDGSEVRYLQLAHNVWDPAAKRSKVQVVYNFGREEPATREALERLVAAKHVLDAATIERRKAAWVQAYRATPHGQPVVLPHNAA